MTETDRHGDRNDWQNSVYDQLHRLAQGALNRETPGHSLQPTMLVHDAYLKLLEQKNVDPADRSQVMAAGATIIRRLLVDYARTRKAQKRGGPDGRGIPLHISVADYRTLLDASWSDATRIPNGGNLTDVTVDGMTLVTTQGPNLWLTRRAATDASWGDFTRLDSPVNSPEVEVGGSLSTDGKLIVFQRRSADALRGADGAKGSIFMATRLDWDAPWSEPLVLKSLQESTDSYVQHPRLLADDLTLLYSANHFPQGDQSPGEYENGFDLYTARLVRKPPVPMEAQNVSEEPDNTPTPME